MIEKKRLYQFAFTMLTVLLLIGCKGDAVEETTPRNIFYGVADGVSFSNTSPKLYKDQEDFFTFIGSAGNGTSIIALINGNEEKEYPATQGELLVTIQAIEALLSLDTSVIGGLIDSLENSTISFAEGESFVFMVSDRQLFYSNRGSITLTQYDGSINRIYGEFDIETTNLIEGPRYIQANFDDVFYTDCPSPGICFL